MKSFFLENTSAEFEKKTHSPKFFVCFLGRFLSCAGWFSFNISIIQAMLAKRRECKRLTTSHIVDSRVSASFTFGRAFHSFPLRVFNEQRNKK